MEKVLFDEDAVKIREAVLRNPLGSYQMGEIARISGLLYMRGVDVIDILKRACGIYGIDSSV